MTDTPSFDSQAEQFDRRAGLPGDVAELVAAAVIAQARLDANTRMLEIGPGTGEIGVHLIAAGVDYLGIDSSAKMLESFAQKLAPAQRGRLQVGDANERWPVADGQLAAVFLARVAHLLDRRALWSEARRCAGPGGCWLLIGRRARDHASVQARMRQQMHALLEAEGVEHRSGGGPNRMIRAMLELGGTSPIRREIACWPVEHRPSAALAAWRSKPGLAGVDVDAAIKDRVLDRLTAWAREQWPDLDAVFPSEEWYELHGLLVPADIA